MPITRKFFDWNRPALPQVLAWLCDAHGVDGYVDLSEYLLVFPGRKAGRRFLELLTEQTDGRNAPPEVITPESLPEHLYETQKPFASDLTQRLAWAEALRSLSEDELGVLLRNLPDADDLDRWLDFGTLLARHHRELAADGLDFSHVAEHGAELPGFDEQRRWEVLRAAQQKYLAYLDSLGLWDQQTARLVAIDHRECRSDKQILLVGAVDLNRGLRLMLDQVASMASSGHMTSGQVTALIHAPESLADHFDEHGCLIPNRWADWRIDLDESQVRVMDGPVDQANEAAYAIADLDGRYRADDIVVGVADESHVPLVRRQLELCGVRARPVAERGVPQSLPALLLAAVADHLEQSRVETFAALVRHPDVAAWLKIQGLKPGWLTKLDDYLVDHLQPRLGEWLGYDDRCTRVREAHQRIEDWLGPLRSDQTLAPSEWSPAIRKLLLTIYGNREFQEEDLADHITLQAVREIDAALTEHELVPDEVGIGFTAADAVRLTLEAVAGAIVPPPPDPDAIPLLGWLELPLDDSPVAVVTNVNEGILPSSVNSDLFLPNALRTKLGLLDNARRYARDAYALSVVLQSREQVTLIVGRRTSEGDPLKPSRLLFAADPETIARRVVRFYGSESDAAAAQRPPLPRGLSTDRETPDFHIPRPQPTEVADQAWSVTAFKDYLACPYRFYLSRVLGLASADDQAEELGGSDFGDLLHHVLAAFGKADLKGSTDESAIAKYLQAELDRVAGRRLGRVRRPAVQLQIEQLRRRLQGFAAMQATRASLGWTIRHVEAAPGDGVCDIDLGDGRSIAVKGRIDRIDYLPSGDLWMILDYKTGADQKGPDEVHRKGGGKQRKWVDLQLPIYRQLAEPLGVTGQVQLAYCLLPEDSQRTQIKLAPWTEDELDEADELVQQVGRGILDQVFWPPRDAAEVTYDDWEAVCQVGLFDGEPFTEAAR